MRSLIVTIVAALVCGATTSSHAGGKVDKKSAGYQALPEAGRALVGKLAAAAAGKKAKAFVALLPAELELGGTTYDHAALELAIAEHGGVARAFGLGKGAWTVTEQGGRFLASRGASTTRFVLAEHDGVWAVQAVFDDGKGFDKVDLLHPELIGSFSAHSNACYAGHAEPASLGAPTASAGLDAAIIHRYLKRKRAHFGYCYDKQLLVEPGIGGVVTTTFVIGSDGTVVKAEASGLDPEVASCIAGVVRAMELPRPTEGQQVRAEFTFTAQAPDDKVFAGGDCDDVPAAVRAVGERLARAIDGGDVADFLALTPAKLPVRGKKLGRAKIEAAIADSGSLAAWLSIVPGDWILEPGRGKSTYHLIRLDDRQGSGQVAGPRHVTVIELGKSRRTWRIKSVQRGCRGIC